VLRATEFDGEGAFVQCTFVRMCTCIRTCTCLRQMVDLKLFISVLLLHYIFY